jgi:hypothetical protein
MKKCERCNNNHEGVYGSGRFCGSKCARGFSTSKKRKEINTKVSKALSGKETWCKGKILVPRVIKECKANSCNNTFLVKSNNQKKVYCSIKCNPKVGGYRKGSGRGKSGWYKGIYCDSSWELSYVMYCKDNNIDIVRNKSFFEYEWNNKTRKFYPDFLVEGSLVEIKGYSTKQWKSKLSSFPSNLSLKVLYKKDIKKYIDYAESHYSKDFIKFYTKKQS